MKQLTSRLAAVTFASLLFFSLAISAQAVSSKSFQVVKQAKQLNVSNGKQVQQIGRFSQRTGPLNRSGAKQLRQVAPNLKANSQKLIKQARIGHLSKNATAQAEQREKVCLRVRSHIQTGLQQYQNHSRQLIERYQLVAHYLDQVALKVESLGINVSSLRQKLATWQAMDQKLKTNIVGLLPNLESLAQNDCNNPVAAAQETRSMRKKIRSIRQQARRSRQYYFAEIRPELKQIRQQLVSLKQQKGEPTLTAK